MREIKAQEHDHESDSEEVGAAAETARRGWRGLCEYQEPQILAFHHYTHASVPCVQSFDEVDFQQLQIEHAQFLEKIDEKNQELLQLKLTTANTVAALNAHKEDMSMLVTDNAWLHREIESKERLLERFVRVPTPFLYRRAFFFFGGGNTEEGCKDCSIFLFVFSCSSEC